MSSGSNQQYTNHPELFYEHRLTEAQNSLKAENGEECYAILLKLINDPNINRIHPLAEARAHCILAIMHSYQAAHHKQKAMEKYEEVVAGNPGDRTAREGLERARRDLTVAFDE
jgi:hypothetical protein